MRKSLQENFICCQGVKLLKLSKNAEHIKKYVFSSSKIVSNKYGLASYDIVSNKWVKASYVARNSATLQLIYLLKSLLRSTLRSWLH